MSKEKIKKEILEELECYGEVIVNENLVSKEVIEQLEEEGINTLKIWKDEYGIHASGTIDEFPNGEECVCDPEDLAEGHPCTCIVEHRSRIADGMAILGFEHHSNVRDDEDDTFD